MELKYIVYITINQCNGKFYIGVHETNPDVFDGYIGNGIYRQTDAIRMKRQRHNNPFINAVVKYGYENFKRTTIRIFPHTEEGHQLAYDLESYLVTSTLLRSKNVYNSSPGGQNSCIPSRPVYMYDVRGKFYKVICFC